MKREPSYPLPRFSVDRPVTVIMILLALLVVGLISYLRIPIALFPEGYERKSLGVYIRYENATPKDIEEKLARPVEEIIGAIVAEFFGSPTVGMGFRISVSVGQLQLDMVWAEITVAALAGSAFYGAVAYTEKRVTFWHPSQRG